MSDTKRKTAGGRAISGVIGGLLVLGILVAVNVIAGMVNVRLDLTEDGLYTLSDGTKRILSRLDTPVTMRFYVTEDARTIPQEFKNLARRVEDFLLEYKKASKGKVRVEKFVVRPDTDAEDSANLDGVRSQGALGQDPIYFGLSVSCLDEKVAIPFIPARPETLLEYDVSRAISQVVSPEKAKVAVMTSIQVQGGFSPGNMNMQQGPAQPWVFYNELRRDYETMVLAPDTAEIPGDIGVLIVMHPHDLTPGAEFAIDQYLLSGGNVIALLDPKFFTAQFLNPRAPNPMAPPPPGVGDSSTLENLLTAWGVEFDATKVVADMRFRTPLSLQNGQRAVTPTVLSLSEDAINRDDVITAQLQDISFLFPGALMGGKEELSPEILLQTSAENEMWSAAEAEPGPGMRKMIEEFAPSGTVRPLALRLSGKFTTAFPGGNPASAEESEAQESSGEEKAGEDEEEDAAGGFLKKSSQDGAVVLFSDADFLYDSFTVQRMGAFIIPRNHNLTLLQNAVEQLAGDSDLITVRSRSTTRRPFTKINEIEANAEQRFSSKIQGLEASLRETEEKLNQIQASKDANQAFILSPEQQAELENFFAKRKEVNNELRQVRKDLRRDIDTLESRLKFSNILGMPVIVIAIGVILAIARRTQRAAR